MAWLSRTQKCISLLTTAAKYLAMGDAVKEAIYACKILSFLMPSYGVRTIKVLGDNQGALQVAENPLRSANSKHVDVRHHFLRDLVEKEEKSVEHIDSENQHADILTKPLARRVF